MDQEKLEGMKILLKEYINFLGVQKMDVFYFKDNKILK